MKKIAMYPLIALMIILLGVCGAMAEPQKGVVYVDSNPQGAEIYLTNVSVSPDNLTVSDVQGVTPREFFVDPGTYRLFLKKYGYITWWNESFTVEPGSYINYGLINLTEKNPVYGAIHIDTEPYGADLVLQRVVPNVTSLIYSTTPASVESLPPGTYNYTLTMDGYYPYEGSAPVEAGNVTEIYVPLVPIPDSADITFKSEPTGARVLLIGGNLSSSGADAMILKAQAAMDGFEGTADEAALKIQSTIGAETIPPVKWVMGLVGTTPFTMELHEGTYMYWYFLDGYSMETDFGEFNVSAGVDKTVEEDLVPNTEYVGVYFETNVDGLPGVDDLTGAQVTVNGVVQDNRTPCWVELPSEKLVNVTFDKMPLYTPTTITVDSTLFVGRPSKWGQVIQLQRAIYYVTATSDAHSTIDPAGIVPIFAGEDLIFNLSGEPPKYLIGNLSVDRYGEGIPPFNVTYNSPSDVYPLQKVLGNASLTLGSTIKKIAVNATAGKGGSVNNAGITLYDYEEPSVVYNFTADPDYIFKELWVDGDQKFTDHWQFQGYEMIQNHTLSGKFRPTKVTITPVAGTGGQILDGGVPATPYIIDYLGCTHEHQIVPDPGYHVKNITITPTDTTMASSEATDILIPSICGIEENTTLSVYFDQGSYNISARAEEGGIIEPSGNFSASYGDEYSFICTAFAGYQLSDILDNGVSQGPVSPYNITVMEDHEIVAYFCNDVLTITAVAGQGGIIEPNGTVNVSYNDSQCFNITADSNYFIDHVLVDDVDLGNQTSPFQYCFTNVTEDHNITASFAQYAYTITPTATSGGIISPDVPQSVPMGGSANFTITADGCHTIGDILIDGTGIGPQVSPFTYTFTDVQEDHTIHSEFLVKTYTILVNETEGGTIVPNGTSGIVQVNCGETQCFTMTPDPGNALYDVIADGVSQGSVTPYCFDNVTSDHTIEPVFIIPPEPDFGADRTRVPPMYPVQFYDYTRNNPTEWLWDFGDGEITNVREPVHYYAAIGNYTVKLVAFNAAAPEGVSITKENYITVTTDPIACFNATPLGGTIPPGVEVQFTDCSLNTDGVAYGWNFGDGEKGAISKNATHIYTTPGVYQVTHKVEKPFIASDYVYDTITIQQEPVAAFIAHPVSGTPPLAVSFEDQSQGFPTSWIWMFGDSTMSYEQNPVHVYDTSGNYSVTLSVSSDEGTSTITKDGYVVIK